MDRPDWAPEDIDIDRPSHARAYDYLLGGSHNFAIDREAARQAMAVMPDVALHAQANRAFLHRAIRMLVGAGMRQFLDIGSGVPTLGNVHEVAQKADPGARVVYVDIDPVAVAHSNRILAGNPGAIAIQEDLRDPKAILDNPEVRRVLDFTQPVALLLVGILHAVSDEEDSFGVVARLAGELPPGSHVAISHPTTDENPEWIKLAELSRRSPNPVTPRTRAEIERYFASFELVEPGLVWVSQWRPDSPDDIGDEPQRTGQFAGVGRKS
jgi:SAM-dependent methyltransferase